VEDDWVCNLIPSLTINKSKSGKVTIIVTGTDPHTLYSFSEQQFTFNVVNISRKWDAPVPCPSDSNNWIPVSKVHHQIGTTLQHPNQSKNPATKKG